ncbi:MAG: type II toxin-antitoxin system prevent-host-death family antitoxin [Gammaproteobacteria bacterium]|nr:type II toxin-antitoxin system prevent-host-death family antitoxin [Gammaproteobacteria bacterium]
MNKVTSGEFQKEFGRYRTAAHKAAVIITNHGRDDLALISADEYKRLRQLDQQAFFADELPNEVIEELGTVPVSKEARAFDDEFGQ